MSTENQVIKIHRDYYINVLKGSETKIKWILKENKKKMDFKKDALARIVETKKNYKKYMEAIGEEEEKQLTKNHSSLLYLNNIYNSQSVSLNNSFTEVNEESEDQGLKISNKSLEANRKLIHNLSKSKIKENHNRTVLISEDKINK